MTIFLCFFSSDSKFLCGLEQKLGGVIAVRYSPEEGLGDFLWSHSTNSMIIGYMNTCERAPMVYILFFSLLNIIKFICMFKNVKYLLLDIYKIIINLKYKSYLFKKIYLFLELHVGLIIA